MWEKLRPLTRVLSIVGLLKPFTTVLAIPLLPFLFNILVKIYARIPFGWAYFDGATFCLALSLYSLTVMRNIYKLNDENLKADLAKPYMPMFAIFLAIYILSLHADTVLLRDVFGHIANMRNITLFDWYTTIHGTVSSSYYLSEGAFVSSESGLIIINIITIIVGVTWLVWSEQMRKDYKIEGELI